MMEGLDGMLLACRASILLDRRETGEPTGIEEAAIIEEAALAAASRITAFLGRMADPDGDEFARGLGLEKCAPFEVLPGSRPPRRRDLA